MKFVINYQFFKYYFLNQNYCTVCQKIGKNKKIYLALPSTGKYLFKLSASINEAFFHHLEVFMARIQQT